jgi:opacity protein-like surface antigen
MRAGWVLGNFMPYGFAGFASGSANMHTSASTRPARIKPSAPPAGIRPCSTASRSAAASDVALTPNFLVRAEYEYDRFVPIFSIPIAIGSVRLGAGFKF